MYLEKNKSPYTYTNPVRKIDFINYIKEPNGYLCGQSVIAMLSNVSVNEVIEIMQNDKGTSIPLMRKALAYYGIRTTTKARHTYKDEIELPECCILSLLPPRYGHWSLYYKGIFYEPEFGMLDELPSQVKIIYYWEVVIG